MMPGLGMEIYAEMAKAVTCAQANLHLIEGIGDAAEAYDEVLQAAVKQSRPIYVSVASDMWEQGIPVALTERALECEPPTNEPKAQEAMVETLWDMLKRAERPLIIADALCYSFNLHAEVDELARITGVPAMSYTSGKGIIEESRPSWSPRLPNTTDYSKNADLVFIFGPLLSDTNTARWSTIPDAETMVAFDLDTVELLKMGRHPIARAESVIKNMRTKELLRALLEKIRGNKFTFVIDPDKRNENDVKSATRSQPKLNDDIRQDDLWQQMSSFLRSDDTLLLANGTPLIGGRNTKLQPNSQVIASAIWNAIGSLLPAAQGVAAAKRDHGFAGRTILFEGDGSFQVTCQAISDIVRYRLDVTIIIANNAGYTYERWLNGMDAEYNDVPSWRYIEAARFFGADLNDSSYPLYSKRVETWGELLGVLEDEKAGDGKGLKIIDIVMDPKDVPEASKPGLLRAADALKSA